MWLRADGAEMTEEDWNWPESSVLGMFVHDEGETLLVWFNRLREPVEATLPQDDLDFEVALVSAIDADVTVSDRRLTLPPRSVVVLAHGNGKL